MGAASAAVLCQLLLLAFCIDTRLELAATRSGGRRELRADDDSDSGVGDAGDDAELRQQMRAVRAEVSQLREDGRALRTHYLTMADELKAAGERVDALGAELELFKMAQPPDPPPPPPPPQDPTASAPGQNDRDGARRRAQRVSAEVAHIIRVETRACPSSGCRTPSHRDESDTGRRMMQEAVLGACAATDLQCRTAQIAAACCDAPRGEVCSANGQPQSCGSSCASVFLPFWSDFHAALGKDAAVFEPTVAMCEASAGIEVSIAMQLGVECTDGSAATGDCVPECTEDLHGYLMLLSVVRKQSIENVSPAPYF